MLAETDLIFSMTVGVTQPAGSNAPEWLTPVIAGVFVIIGGVLSALSGWWADERRSKREHRRRWHEEIRRYSAELLSDIDAYWDTVTALRRTRDESASERDTSTESKFARIEELEARKTQLANAIYRNQTQLGFVVPAATMFPLSSLVDTTLGGQLESMIQKDPQGTADYIGGKKAEFLIEIREVLETAPKT